MDFILTIGVDGVWEYKYLGGFNPAKIPEALRAIADAVEAGTGLEYKDGEKPDGD